MGYLEKYLYLSTTAVAPFYGTFLIIGLLFVPTSGHTVPQLKLTLNGYFFVLSNKLRIL